MTQPQDVLNFWFEELEPQQWWVKDTAVDEQISQRFGAALTQAVACELWTWRESAAGRLAEIIVLDQFSRNVFRDSPKAWAADPLALALAQEAVALGVDQQLEPEHRAFMYLPYMHSESKPIHTVALSLFENLGQQANLDAEIKHKAVIDRFGRYPHRNAVLGRPSTPEEEAFLKEPGSSF